MMEENSEIVTKYQKLALEYSKLKAQSSVLKTAVSEEQILVRDLQDDSKKKDQLIRKLEQEVECLNFRNLQLSKRVSVLQTDLENADSGSKHSKGKNSTNSSASMPESYMVLNNELQSRIEENERLHQEIYSSGLEHQKQVAEMSSAIEALQANLSEQERKFSEKIKDQETLISSLQKEKIKMQVNIKNYEQEIKEKKVNEETVTRDITIANEDLSSQLDEAKNVIANKVQFNDRSKDYLNSLNVPVIQRGKHQSLVGLMLKMHGFIADFSRQLSDLNTFMIQRVCQCSDSSIKPVTDKLEMYLRESIQHLKVIPNSFDGVLSAVKAETFVWDKSAMLNFCDTFQKYEKSVDKMLPFLILRIQNTDSWTTASSKMIELIQKLVSSVKKISACCKTLLRYLLLLATTGSAENNGYVCPQATIVNKILASIETLLELFEESRKQFGSKIALDHQMPMITEAEKSTDECILSTLVSLSTSLKKITDLIRKDLDIFTYDIWYIPRHRSKSKNDKYSPSVWVFKERGRTYMERVGQADDISIPYEVALKNHQTLCDHSDNQESLTQQLEQYRNKLMQLELDKENWMLECQLMKARESKSSDMQDDGVEIKAQDYDEIHSFVRNTVNQLIKQIQFADSKAMAYKSECDALHQRLQISVERRGTLEGEMTTAKKTIEILKDEQKTMVQSYNEQLNTMSEHLANLNETLTAQKDKIDLLEQSGNKKTIKKGKSK